MKVPDVFLLPAARDLLPATTHPQRADANGQCEKTMNEAKGAERAAGSGQQAAEKQAAEKQVAGSGQQVADNSFSLPRALWLNDTIKTVDVIREIWEIEDEWWRDHIARRYFDVILDGGKHLVIYQDRLTGQWFAQTP